LSTPSLRKRPPERAGGGKRTRLLRNGLVVSEISLALLLMMGAGLFVRSLTRLSAVNLGFSDDHLLVADLPVPPAGTAPAEAHRNMDFYENTLRQLRTLPGVEFGRRRQYRPAQTQGPQ
jgi:putative ABC transport system permease protein